MQQYKWNHPSAWLEEWLGEVAENGTERLLFEARTLASLLNEDQIQDEYQAEMTECGYFEPLQETDQ